MRRPSNVLLALLPLIAGCIRDVGRGPYMGECAEPPEGVYTYGETGIGTCLSGPTDLQFFNQDGTDWLAVTNADPYRMFASGSLLLIDWSSIDLGRETNYVDEIDSYAVDTDPYVGGIGYVADDLKKVLLVAGRLSEDSRTRSAKDEMWVYDVSDPTNPQPWSLGDRLQLKDDPEPIAVHDGFGRAYVANLTDHSISVVDTTGAPIAPIDVAPHVELGADTFDDADASGSTAEVSLTLTDSHAVTDDLWSMTWVDASFRLWVPTPEGLHRWLFGGSGYIDTGTHTEIDPGEYGLVEVADPYYTTDLAGPEMLFESAGELYVISQLASGVWSTDSLGKILGGGDEGAWDHLLGGPSTLVANNTALIYYDGQATEDSDAAIGLAVFDSSGFASRLAEPVLAPAAPYTSFEDPWVRTDLLAQRYRMWLSMWDGTKWTIGLSESSDTGNWTTPTEVLADATAQSAAPTVVYSNGRYRMWFTRGDGTAWHVAEAWSYDGVHWNDVTEVLDIDDGAYDPRHPPRIGTLADATGGWRVESATHNGPYGVAYASGEFGTTGFSIRAANGYEAGPTTLGDDAASGLLPTSTIDWDGHDYVYVTTVNRASRNGIGLVERIDGDWVGVASDLVPKDVGGNVLGAGNPVVVAQGAGLTMYYSAAESGGIERLRRATSTDGITWTPADIHVPDPGEWDLAGRRPHSIEPLAGGGMRLWFTGTDGAVQRIGAMTSADGVTFTLEPGELDDWQIGVGPVGAFDDSGVADPEIYVDGTTTHLWYAAFDGQAWSIGHSTRTAGSTAWVRDEDVVTGADVPKLFGVQHTFSAAGVRSPVLRIEVVGDTVTAEGLYAGFDGATWRMGRAIGALSRLYPAQRFPTPGDVMTFETLRGDPSGGVIELQQRFDGFFTTGFGVSSMRLDPERGFLYVTAKTTGPSSPANFVYVIDVRDDTREGFADRNFLDIEAVLLVGQTTYASGFRDAVPIPGTDLLYASGHVPDSVVVFDLSLVVDDDKKDVINDAALTALPLHRVPTTSPSRPFQDEDQGTQSQQRISGAGIEVSPDGSRLYVAHFRQNSLLAYDLRLGSYGEEIRRTSYIGENPHLVRISPDGHYAVVANYLGDVDDDDVSHSTLAIVDIDPTSPDYMQIVTWIKNL